ncbi:MAG: hypothetical protein OQK55_03490 [Thermoanaerobaculales bacterium]|nr:hypothetical protein [Thermoanaerobaculales bacterium]
MSNPFRYAIAVATVLLAVLVAAPACQCDSVEPIKRIEHDVAVEQAEPDSKYPWKTIPDIDVSSGDTIRFTTNEHTIWVLIPDNRFKLVEGGSDWVVSKSFTAFKVAGYAIIKLDKCLDESDSPKEKIHYSIMVLDGKEESGRWEYVHGDNPPPRMIVPPRR